MVVNRRLRFLVAVFSIGVAGVCIVNFGRLNTPPIRSDGVGYYLYLPAIFIYHDISLRRIAQVHFKGEIPQWTGVTPYASTNKYLIKYPIGESLLLLPFFLIACFLSYIFKFKMNGFSLMFQSMAAVSGLFYATAGLAMLWSVLEKYFKENTVLLVLIALLCGTNLFHYAVYDGIFSHIYSFFLFCAFLYLIDNYFYSNPSIIYMIATGAVAGLIIVTRPTNGLWLFIGAFYGVTSIQELGVRLLFWRISIRKYMLVLMPFFLVVFIQLLYWKSVTGKFVVYSYSNEYFNFLNPEIANVLFSVRKGLFFWSPILLAVFPGLFYVKKKFPAVFYPALIFLPLNIYVISSWYCWWYGGGFGHRSFVESTPIFAVCLCSLYESISSLRIKRVFISFMTTCIIFTSWMMIRYWSGVIPWDGLTFDHLVKTFFVLRKSGI